MINKGKVRLGLYKINLHNLLCVIAVLLVCLGLATGILGSTAFCHYMGTRQVSVVNVTSNEDEIFYSTTETQQDAALVDCYENIVAITFDDGPSSSSTKKLLDGLKERRVKATFFLIGRNISGNESLVKRMSEEGHLVGNHTYTHVDAHNVSLSQMLGEIDSTNKLIESVTGEVPQYIRFPFGRNSEKIIGMVDMTPVLWSVDPDDWNTEDVGRIVNEVVDNVKCGDIILLHDIYETSVVAALEIIDRLQDRGFVFVTVDQLLLD